MTIQATKYSEVIAKKVTDGIKSGVSVKDIMGSIQQYQNAPSSSATFYKLYGQLIKQTRADSVEQVGNVVYNMAIQGDFKAAEFYLRSKGGWSPNSTVNEVEQEVEPDEDLAAIDSVMSILGKNTTPDENNS